MRRQLTSSLVLTLVLSATAAAQGAQRAPGSPPPAGNGEVHGLVLDAKDSVPLGRASVAVRSRKDSSLVSGAIANAAGVFRVQGLRNGAYYLRVTGIGYSPKTQNFAITDTAPAVNAGTIRLSRFAVALKGVEVVEDRATMAIEPDRNSYRAKDVAPAAANASEVLDATPSVSVDQDGKVSLRGNENVVVQINGRPTPMSGTQLGAYLKTLPANVIERIEVVPNPSAKYDPEGMAGIINIALKSSVDLGFSGGGNASAANRDRYNAGGNVGYQAGPMSSFINIGVNDDNRNVVGVNDLSRLNASLLPTSFTNQDIATLTGNSGQNVNANMDYKVTARDVWSNALSINHHTSIDQTTSAYQELAGGGALTSTYDRTKDTKASGSFVDYDMAFKRTFEPRKHEWSAELRANRSEDGDHTNLFRSGDAPGQYLEGERDVTEAVTKQYTAQTDYLRMLAQRTKLETGFKANTRIMDRDYDVTKDSLGTGAWSPSPLTNSLSFTESVAAVYGVVSQGLGNFDLQAGLRGEEAHRDFKLSDTDYPFTYGSLFPSGVVSYNFSDGLNAKVSYSRRIRRPGTQELNPFPSFFDIQNVFIGNPQLNPEYTDALEFGLTRSGQYGTVQLSPFYRRTTNVIRVIINTADHIDGRDVTTITFGNLATSNSFGTDLNTSLRLGQKLNGFAGFNVFKVVTDGGSLSTLSSNAVTWAGRLNATSWVTPNWMIQANYQYRAPLKIERGEFAAVTNVNFAIRRKIDGDNSSVTLRVLDPFSTNHFSINVGDDNVQQLTQRTAGVRGVFLFYQYSFGPVPRIRQPEQQQQGGGTPFP